MATAAVRAAGPVRRRRAPRSSLARLLCSYLDSAARAQEFPVMPPAAPSVARSREGGGRRTAAAARLPRSVRRTLPRPLALCLGLCLATAAASTLPGESAKPACPIRPSDPSEVRLGTRTPLPPPSRERPRRLPASSVIPRPQSPGGSQGRVPPRDSAERGQAGAPRSADRRADTLPVPHREPEPREPLSPSGPRPG